MKKLIEDSKFKAINELPLYLKNAHCDDCPDKKDLVRRAEGDGLYFCKNHWNKHLTQLFGPFLEQ